MDQAKETEEMEGLDFFTKNWMWIMIAFWASEKVVKLTPTKYDDILVDMIIGPVLQQIKGLSGKK